MVPQYSCKKAVDLVNCYFAYKFGSGWERGRVVGIEKNKNSADYGMYIVKFPSEDTKRCLALNQEDYDIDDIWVQIKRTWHTPRTCLVLCGLPWYTHRHTHHLEWVLAESCELAPRSGGHDCIGAQVRMRRSVLRSTLAHAGRRPASGI